MTLVGLPPSFQATSPTMSTHPQDTRANRSQSRITFSTAGWADGERTRLSKLVNHLRQVNDTLSGFVKEQASLDIIASAALLHTWAPRTEDSQPFAGVVGDVHDRHLELSRRVSFQQQYSSPMQCEPRIFPLASIRTDEGAPSSLSNYRLLSAFDVLDKDKNPAPGMVPSRHELAASAIC